MEKAYKSKFEIVPLGCDCHPAYVLQKLHIRKYSLPFDWLNNSSIKSIEYINQNFSTNFEFFMKDLILNEKGNVVAKKYPYCEFLHEPNLIENEKDKLKFKRRINRLLNIKQSKKIHYINNISSQSINSKRNIEYFLSSVKQFINNHLKKEDLLSIYRRFDESFEENSQYTNKLVDELNKLDKITCVNYLREHSKYPTWGNPKYFPKLLKDLDIEFHSVMSKIYIKYS